MQTDTILIILAVISAGQLAAIVLAFSMLHDLQARVHRLSRLLLDLSFTGTQTADLLARIASTRRTRSTESPANQP